MAFPCPMMKLTARPKYAPNAWTKIDPPESLACQDKGWPDMSISQNYNKMTGYCHSVTYGTNN